MILVAIFREVAILVFMLMNASFSKLRIVARKTDIKRKLSRGTSRGVAVISGVPWKLPLTAIGIGGCIGYQHYERLRAKHHAQKGLPVGWPTWKVLIYRALPLRLTSRVWGWAASKEMSRSWRRSVIGLYASTYGCNMEEAEYSEIEDYPSLKAFFARRLKDGTRPIGNTPVVSPADGLVIKCGEVNEVEHVVEQIKGLSFDLDEFVGPTLVDEIRAKEDSKLFYCVVYLAPGDYHGFHSPVQWEVSTRRHFSGKLLSVNSYFLARVAKIFSLNERVLLWGKWKHGAFSMTAVGATNVGNIYLTKEPDLVTNQVALAKTLEDKTVSWEEQKGDRLGGFHLGSSVVLLFQAPKNFQFLVPEGTTVKLGQPLGAFKD